MVVQLVIKRLVDSDTIDNSRIMLNKAFPVDKKIRDTIVINVNSDAGSEIYKALYDNHDINILFNGEDDDLINALKDFYDNWAIENSHFYVDLVGTENEKKNLVNVITKISKSGNRYQDLKNPRSWVTKATFLKRYKLYGIKKGNVRNIPYLNYLTNDNNDNYCVLNYALNTYAKRMRTEKTIRKYFDSEGVECEKIFEFCEKFKIRCILYNIAGKVIYNNEYQHNKSNRYNDFIGIISNNHFYPFNNKFKNFKPTLTEEKLNDNKDDNNEITITENNNYYSSNSGKQRLDNFDTEIQKTFFIGLFPNFTYKSYENIFNVKPLFYFDKSIENYKIHEYDMIKSYYTLASELINDNCPVFSCKNILQKYNNEDILLTNYYLISEKGLKKINKYGFISNNLEGFVLSYLIDENLITKKDIEYYIEPTYIFNWCKIKERINKLKQNLPDLEDKYIFYNGILGQLKLRKVRKITGLYEDEEHLLNTETEQWIKDYDDILDLDEIKPESYTLYNITTSFKYINSVNIYNHIISHSQLFMLKEIRRIEKNYPKIKILKIKTDAIGLSHKLPAYNKYFRYENKEKPDKILFNKYLQQNLIINDGEKLNKKIDDELKCLDTTISFTGAPGTGKTHTVKKNYDFDFGATWTNLCTFNMCNNDEDKKKINTVYSMLHLYDPSKINKFYKKYYNKTLWIDEFSMLPTLIYNFIFILINNYNVKVIITGDTNQTPPIGEEEINFNNPFFKKLFSNNKELKEDFRNSKELIELREKSLKLDLEELHNIFKNKNDEFLHLDTHICATNKYRDQLNSLIMEKRNLKFEKNNDNFNVSKGVILNCRMTNKTKRFYKNDRFIVINENEIQNLRTGENRKIQNKEYNYFELGFAITSHSSQGMTIKKFAIHQIKKLINWNRKILYTAITRGINIEDISFIYNKKLTNQPLKIKYDNIKEDTEQIFNVFDTAIYL